MPEVRKRDEEFVDEIERAPAPPVEIKKRGKWRMLLFMIFLFMGGLTGLHMSGIVDARPMVWSIVPKIPFIGEQLKTYLDIPEVYTLTVDERRKLELEQWQARLDARERDILAKISQAEAMSSDIAARTQQIRKQEDKLRGMEPVKKDEGAVSEEEKALMDELIRTYQEISPRRAALIVARLRDDLAVELLKKLPQDARASIMSKLEPRRAAAITEMLATPAN